MDLKDIKSVYFIGIGGIGMSALARYFNMKGIKVSGYDKTETDLTKTLVSEGIEIHYEDNINLLPVEIDLVVYTPAVPTTHSEYQHLLQNGKTIMKRAQLLGLISKMQKTIAIAGTHGKTTTSSMTAHVLLKCGEPISAFLGGILSGYETNYFLGESDWVVVEADEFDRSFLHLSPEISVVNSIEPDHLDIYGDASHVKESYWDFIQKLREGQYLLLSEYVIDDLKKEEVETLQSKYKVKVFGFSEHCDVRLSNVKVIDGAVYFDYKSEFAELENVKMLMPGYHNVMNASVAITVALMLNKSKNDVLNAIASFRGVKRRFERIVEGEIDYIDDYAHHPTEIRMAVTAVKMMYPDKKVVGIFQPHLFSRTRDFADDFAEELGQLDEVILMEIYPARELPIEGINSTMLLNKIKNENKHLLTEEEILNRLKNKNYDVVMTLGAGNIDLLIPKIKQLLIC